ncbi:hypothetical protein G6F56_009820 [Rhizopus delemar]|nr:hypothetical protein G6F56_009820 [Rhizopus delemar]
MTRLEQNTRAFGLEEVPTFHPTAEEFQDPLSYIEKISSEGSKYGMVKISPPSDYKPEFALDTELKQAVANRGGLDSVDQDKKWNEIGLNLGHAAKNLHGMANTLRTAYVNIILPFEIWEARHKDVDLFELQEISETEVDENKACEVCADIKDEANMMLCDGCCGAYHIYCLSPPLKNVPKTDWFCQSCLEVVKNKVESRCYNLSEFEDRSERFKREWFQSPKVPVDECECEFWKLVKSKETFEVEYGLGLHGTEHGSGFKRPEDFSLDTFDPWNLNVIPASQKSLFTHVKSDNHQLMTPWIYVGMCFSALCWKIEQHSTYSISYLHWGDPKTCREKG